MKPKWKPGHPTEDGVYWLSVTPKHREPTHWHALAKTLAITTEIRPVYRAGKRGFLTKDAAIRDAIKGIARSLDYCDCAPSEPDTMDGRGYPGNYCGCRERIEEMIEVLTPIAKRLPESQAEWDGKTSEAFWESYKFRKEDEP